MIKRSESFGKAAKEYQKYRTSYDLRTYKLLASLLGGAGKKYKRCRGALNSVARPRCKQACACGLARNYKILDIGCGTGKSTEPLAEIFKQAEIIGADPDEKMLEEARFSAKEKKLSIKYIKARAEKIPLADNYFDAVIAGTAFHWFGTKKAIKEIGRVLKKGGIFFVFWRFFKENGAINWLKIRRKYIIKSIARKFKDNPPALKKLFKESGFGKTKISRIAFKEKRIVSEEIGALKTNAAYMALPAQRKKDYIKEITEAYEKIQDNKNFIITEREIFIGYGFKK